MIRPPIPARLGAFVHLYPGKLLKIINTHGTQVVDTWAFTSLPNGTTKESSFKFRYLSMCHTKSALSKLTLNANDSLLDNARQPMLTLIGDKSDSVHGLLFVVCDAHQCEQLGVKRFHDSCAYNLVTQLDKTLTSSKENLSGAITLASLATGGWTPDPLKLFMNVPMKVVGDGKGGKTSLAAPSCPGGGLCCIGSRGRMYGHHECLSDGFNIDL
jgi:uncharacterized protein